MRRLFCFRFMSGSFEHLRIFIYDSTKKNHKPKLSKYLTAIFCCCLKIYHKNLYFLLLWCLFVTFIPNIIPPVVCVCFLSFISHEFECSLLRKYKNNKKYFFLFSVSVFLSASACLHVSSKCRFVLFFVLISNKNIKKKIVSFFVLSVALAMILLIVFTFIIWPNSNSPTMFIKEHTKDKRTQSTTQHNQTNERPKTSPCLVQRERKKGFFPKNR